MRIVAPPQLLLVAWLSGTANAQDFPHGRYRAYPPRADSSIVAMLDSLAPAIDFDVIHVRPSPAYVAGSSCLAFDSVGQEYFQQYYGEMEPGSGFTIGVESRVPIGPGFMGYTFCAPGMYGPTVVDLWVYDQTTLRWLPPVELADDWGDAGEWYQAHSWLLDLNSDGYRDILKRGKHAYWDECYFDKLALQVFTKEGYTTPEIVTDSVLRAKYDFGDPCNYKGGVALPNQRLQLTLLPTRRLPLSQVSAGLVGAADFGVDSFDPLRCSFRRGAAETLIR